MNSVKTYLFICCVVALSGLAIWHFPGSSEVQGVTKTEKIPGNPGYQEQWLKMRANSDGNIPKETVRSIREMQGSGTRGGGTLEFLQELGPYNIAGRTRAILVDDFDPNHIFAGSVSGGLWESFTRGSSWEAVNDFEASLAVTSIDQDPFDWAKIYYTTGEVTGNTAGIDGNGVYKSIDNGNNFTHLTNTENFGDIWTVKCSQWFQDHVYVGTSNNGLYRSMNGGGNWEQVFLEGTNDVNSVVLLPDTSVLIAVRNRGVYRSPNGNVGTWTLLNNGIPDGVSGNMDRVEIANAKNTPYVVYVQIEVESGDSIMGVYKTIDGGLNWNLLTNPASDDIRYRFPWYAFMLGVKPDDPDYVLTGCVEAGFSTNSGNSWTPLEHSHADYHTVVFDESNTTRLYVGNDGGFYEYNTNNIDFLTADKNFGYNVTQFYAGYFYPWGTSVVGGAQDNGTLVSLNDNDIFEHVFGGDGGYSFIHPQDPNYAYISTQRGLIWRTDQAMQTGPNFDLILNEMDANNDDIPDEQTWFINPFEMNPLDGDQLYMITYDRVWRSTNKGDNWEHLTEIISPGNSNPYCLGISNDLNPTLYIGGENRLFWRIENAMTATPGSETSLVSQVPVGLVDNFMSCITVHPNDPTTLLISFSDYTSEPRIWKVTNAHTASPNWQPLTGDLPAGLPVNWVEIDPDNPESYYIIATDFGIYTTSNGGTNWVLESNLPNVSVHQIRLRTSDRNLFIFTHGRGAWVAGLPGAVLAPVKPEEQEQHRLSVYPNPATEHAEIQFDYIDSRQQAQLQVFDMAGKEVFKTNQWFANKVKIKIADWQPGTYLIVATQGQKQFSGKLLKI